MPARLPTKEEAEKTELWPNKANELYERIEVLGRGSFGLVWMCQRKLSPVDELDDEFVALKNIEIKENKGKVYAQREISILSELRHPNVIRLIRAFPIFNNTSRLVALQLARGPNLQRVVGKHGALGLPLARLVCRQLIAAVSYLHGRAVLHRDIKPTNCILENATLAPDEYYDYARDHLIWSDDADAEEACRNNRWKLMLVDFGFARALEDKEIHAQSRPMRNSILLEPLKNKRNNNDNGDIPERKIDRVMSTAEAAAAAAIADQLEKMSDFSDMDDEEKDKLVERAAAAMHTETVEAETEIPFVAIGDEDKVKTRRSYVSSFQFDDDIVEENKEKPIPEEENHVTPSAARRQSATKKLRAQRHSTNRMSTTRAKMRSMSALGTKAYAAPEIKDQLRNKTASDIKKRNAALTECVADYGMIVDAYSVGWTLRVVLTGVPPNSTISQYMRKQKAAAQAKAMRADDASVAVGCFCFGNASKEVPTPKKEPPSESTMTYRIRDTDTLPQAATLLVAALTRTNPEERMTVREAQIHPWIKGSDSDPGGIYIVPQGDIPSLHGDPVVPLKCAPDLTYIVEQHHH